MNTDIRYIFLDLGGTFRVIDEDPAYLASARKIPASGLRKSLTSAMTNTGSGL